MSQTPNIYISHSHSKADAAWCDRFVDELRRAGADVWYDQQVLPTGSQWGSNDVELVARSVFIAVLSPAAVRSPWVRREFAFAAQLASHDSRRIIMPVVAERCDIPSWLGVYKRISRGHGSGFTPRKAAGRVAHALGLRFPRTSTSGDSAKYTFPTGPRFPQPSNSNDVTKHDAFLRFHLPQAFISRDSPKRNLPTGPHFPLASVSDDDRLRFTAFHPEIAYVEQWSTLLTYAHIRSALTAIDTDASKFLDELGDAPKSSGSAAPAHLLRGAQITLVPRIDAVEFNPPSVSFKWTEDWHREYFRFRADSALAGTQARGAVDVCLESTHGPLPIARVSLSIYFRQTQPAGPSDNEASSSAQVQGSSGLYKQIFLSYAHEDVAVVQDCCAVYRALGIRVKMDSLSLHSGEYFPEALKRLIVSSDIFQLFWSAHAAESKWVRWEWEHALSCNRGEGFIRPVYWEEPMAPPPEELACLHFALLRREHRPSRAAG